MNRRITITVDENVTDEEALRSVLAVVWRGRISGPCYCLRSAFSTYPDGEIVVSAGKTTTGNDRFSAYRNYPEESAP